MVNFGIILLKNAKIHQSLDHPRAREKNWMYQNDLLAPPPDIFFALQPILIQKLGFYYLWPFVW